MFKTRLMECAAQVQLHLDSVLVPMGELPVVQAMRYASHGGKRLRAFLVLESTRLHGISADQAIWPAAAIEAMHAYTLVHDDLPCMDDDDMRRGQPTVHVKWNEETAVLAESKVSLFVLLFTTEWTHQCRTQRQKWWDDG